MALPILPLEISPFRRICAAGCDLTIKYTADARYCLRLVRGEEVVATAYCVRNGAMNKNEALDKLRLNRFRPSTGIYQVACELAAIAEALPA